MKTRADYVRGHDDLVNEIIAAVCATRIAVVWSNPTGAAYREYGEEGFTKKKVLVRYGLKGSPDIEGIMLGGRYLGIEVKTGRATQQDNQKKFEAMIKRMGGIYFVARSVEDALSLLKIAAASSKG